MGGLYISLFYPHYLVGGLEHVIIIFFPYSIYYIGNNNSNSLSYFAEGLKPPTRNIVSLCLKPVQFQVSKLR